MVEVVFNICYYYLTIMEVFFDVIIALMTLSFNINDARIIFIFSVLVQAGIFKKRAVDRGLSCNCN